MFTNAGIGQATPDGGTDSSGETAIQKFRSKREETEAAKAWLVEILSVLSKEFCPRLSRPKAALCYRLASSLETAEELALLQEMQEFIIRAREENAARRANLASNPLFLGTVSFVITSDEFQLKVFDAAGKTRGYWTTAADSEPSEIIQSAANTLRALSRLKSFPGACSIRRLGGGRLPFRPAKIMTVQLQHICQDVQLDAQVMFE